MTKAQNKCKCCGKKRGAALCVGALLETFEGVDPSLPVKYELAGKEKTWELGLVVSWIQPEDVGLGFVKERRLD